MARIIFVNKRDLNLKMMLEGGQCFRYVIVNCTLRSDKKVILLKRTSIKNASI